MISRHIKALRGGLELFRQCGARRAAREGKMYLRKSAFRLLHGISGKESRGSNIFERDWEVLIILDACRLDAAKQVGREYDFIETVDHHTSLASNSQKWMERNFGNVTEDVLRNTAYVTGNPFSDNLVDESEWERVKHVWKHSWDEETGTIHPRPITDQAISLMRSSPPDRMIVHYMQPHTPFVRFDDAGHHSIDRWDKKGYLQKTEWEKLRDGELTYDEVWEGYLNNLRYVLDDVELLVNNVSSDSVVISADHGECAGERGLYGHPSGITLDALRKVPWIETRARDSGNYDPGPEVEHTGVSKEEQLAALGYT